MSLIRSSYRSLLKRCLSLSLAYPNPHDFYFAIFGVLARPSDFITGGYGNTPYRVLRTCFERPSQSGEPGDTLEERIKSCFAMIRRLNEIQEAAERRQRLLNQLPHRKQVFLTPGVDNEGNVMIRTTEKEAPFGLAVEQSSFSSKEQKEHDEQSSDLSISTALRSNDSGSDASSSVSPCRPSQTFEQGRDRASTDFVWDPKDTPKRALLTQSSLTFDHAVLCRGTFLIQQKVNDRSQKFYRHAVVSNDSNTFPPYPLLLPPEPMYTRDIRHFFSFPLLYDIVYCLCASFRSASRTDQQTSLAPVCIPDSSSSPLSMSTSDPTSVLREDKEEEVRDSRKGSEEDDSEDEESILKIFSEEEEEEMQGEWKEEREEWMKADDEKIDHETKEKAPLSSSSLSFLSPFEWDERIESARLALTVLPTSSLTVTDFVEVEVFTRFIVATKENLVKDKIRVDGVRENTAESSRPSFTVAYAGRNPLRRSVGSDRFSPPGSETLIYGKEASKPSSNVHVFGYAFIIRNLSGVIHPKEWHLQLLSHHLVVADLENPRQNVMEVSRPGIGGNFLTLRPGESHFYEGGASLVGTEGILRGTIQVNAFCKGGTTRAFDLHISPTRLSVNDSWYNYSSSFSAVGSSDSSVASPSNISADNAPKGRKNNRGGGVAKENTSKKTFTPKH